MDESYIEFNENANTSILGVCSTLIVEGCTDALAYNYNPLATLENGSCIALILGCIDSAAFNYDQSANTDDGSCVSIVEGCTDPLAFNYNPFANLESNPSNCEPVILGCTDVLSFNYNSLVNTDDGSCTSIIEGCTNPLAFNYNPDANTEFHPSNCIPVILGCREAGYLEFNELANVDDGSCMTLWSELYANAINELEIININNESLNSSIESLENDLNIINQIFQDSVQFYETQIFDLQTSYNYNLNSLESEILSLETDLSTTIVNYENHIDSLNNNHIESIDNLISSHANELSLLALDTEIELSQLTAQYKLDSINLVLDYELELDSLTSFYNNQIMLLNEEDVIEDQSYEYLITNLQADSINLAAQVSALQVESLDLELQINSLDTELTSSIDSINTLKYENSELEVTVEYLASSIEDLNNDNIFLSNELNYYSAPILIDLLQGWNIIGFSLQEPMDVVASLEILGDKIHLIKNNNAQLYWPEYGYNNIESLLPGQGYQIRMYEEHLGFSFPYIPGQRINISPTIPEWVLEMDVEIHPNDIRTLVRVIDMLGHEVSPDEQFVGQVLLHMFNDGSVEKIVVK